MDVVQKHALAVDARLKEEEARKNVRSSNNSSSSSTTPEAQQQNFENEREIDDRVNKLKQTFNELVQRLDNIKKLAESNN